MNLIHSRKKREMTKKVLHSAPHFFRSFWPSIRCVPPTTFLRLLLPTLLPFSVVHAAPNELHAFFEARCVDCHDSETKKGGLDLTTLKLDAAGFETWVKVHAMGAITPWTKVSGTKL